VDYTDLNGDTVIARYRVSLNPDVADPASAVILLTIPQPFANHNGGSCNSEPDGTSTSEWATAAPGGDPLNNAQNLNSLLGKILRIDVGSLPYGIPVDNPFRTNLNARPEIWAYGLPNPWRFSFDLQTGDLSLRISAERHRGSEFSECGQQRRRELRVAVDGRKQLLHLGPTATTAA
jgi:glucose/arabinose dehydrogenase